MSASPTWFLTCPGKKLAGRGYEGCYRPRLPGRVRITTTFAEIPNTIAEIRNAFAEIRIERLSTSDNRPICEDIEAHPDFCLNF